MNIDKNFEGYRKHINEKTWLIFVGKYGYKHDKIFLVATSENDQYEYQLKDAGLVLDYQRVGPIMVKITLITQDILNKMNFGQIYYQHIMTLQPKDFEPKHVIKLSWLQKLINWMFKFLKIK